MDAEDLFDVKKTDKFDYAISAFTAIKGILMSKKRYTIIKAVYQISKYRLLFGLFLNLLGNLTQFAGPYILKGIINYIEDPTYETWKGYVFASLLLVTFICRAILQ